MTRGEAATGLPSIHKSAASQPTSGRHGRGTRVSASGIANMSGWAGVISSHVANPAKPAPSFCIVLMAAAGTSLARATPNKSAKLIKKYRNFFWAATACKSVISFSLVVCNCRLDCSAKRAKTQAGKKTQKIPAPSILPPSPFPPPFPFPRRRESLPPLIVFWHRAPKQLEDREIPAFAGMGIKGGNGDTFNFAALPLLPFRRKPESHSRDSENVPRSGTLQWSLVGECGFAAEIPAFAGMEGLVELAVAFSFIPLFPFPRKREYP